MLKLNLQYCGHLMWKDNSLEKSLMLGNIKGRRRRGHQGMRGLDDITKPININGQTLGDGEGQEGLACCSPWGCKESATTGWLKNNSNKMWNLEKLYRQIHLKIRSRDAHIVNRHVGMRWGVEWRWIGRLGLTHTCVKLIASGNLLYSKGALLSTLWWPILVGWGRDGGPRGRDLYIYVERERERGETLITLLYSRN